MLCRFGVEPENLHSRKSSHMIPMLLVSGCTFRIAVLEDWWSEIELAHFTWGLSGRFHQMCHLGSAGLNQSPKHAEGARCVCCSRVSPEQGYTCFQSPGAASCFGQSHVGLLSLGPCAEAPGSRPHGPPAGQLPSRALGSSLRWRPPASPHRPCPTPPLPCTRRPGSRSSDRHLSGHHSKTSRPRSSSATSNLRLRRRCQVDG